VKFIVTHIFTNVSTVQNLMHKRTIRIYRAYHHAASSAEVKE